MILLVKFCLIYMQARWRSTMARQNARVSDESRTARTVTMMALSSRPRFLPSMPKLRWAPGRFIGSSRKHLVKIEPEEGEGGEDKIKPCLQSMRSSSPTRHRPGQPAPSSGPTKWDSWVVSAMAVSVLWVKRTKNPHPDINRDTEFLVMIFILQMRHPSAINMFTRIANAAKGKQIVMFLDYDGTLSPIVADPDRAFMSSQVYYDTRTMFMHTVFVFLFFVFFGDILTVEKFFI